MKIMKMWRNTTLFAYFRFMGYVMMIVGIYLIVNGIETMQANPVRRTDSHRGHGHGCLQRGSQLFARKAW